jgi:hypothetical protein
MPYVELRISADCFHMHNALLTARPFNCRLTQRRGIKYRDSICLQDETLRCFFVIRQQQICIFCKVHVYCKRGS